LPNGLQFVHVQGNGHCLYNAVELYLGQDVSLLRDVVAANLENNISEYQQFITLPEGRTMESYIQDVRDGNEWAGDLEITILSKLLNRPIIAINPNIQIINKQILDIRLNNEEPIFVYYDNINHYNGLILTERNSGAGAILEKLLQRPPPEMTEHVNPHSGENAEVISCTSPKLLNHV
ncbi:MAG: OTU domain-containing protein, partial [Gammaproteobacteria bacterium]